MSPTNAKRLAEAIDKISADAVGADDDLLAKAESMTPEQFARETRRWVTDREGDGESQSTGASGPDAAFAFGTRTTAWSHCVASSTPPRAGA